jgi:hypothetical protein
MSKILGQLDSLLLDEGLFSLQLPSSPIHDRKPV